MAFFFICGHDSLQVTCPHTYSRRVFYQFKFFVRVLKLCTRKMLHAPSQYIAIIHSLKNVLTPGAHLQKLCTQSRKCAHRVQGARLISDTVYCWVALAPWLCCGSHDYRGQTGPWDSWDLFQPLASDLYAPCWC